MYVIQDPTKHRPLEELQAAIAAAEKVQKQTAKLWQNYSKEVADADPMRWAIHIEQRADNKTVLADFRVIREEELLSCEAARLAYIMSFDELKAKHALLSAAVLKAIEFHDTLTNNTAKTWLKPLIENNCVVAGQLLKQEPPGNGISLERDFTGFYYLTKKLLTNAFKALNQSIVAHYRAGAEPDAVGLFVGHSLVTLYPQSFARGLPSESKGNRDERNLTFIEVPGCSMEGAEPSQSLAREWEAEWLHISCHELPPLLVALLTACEQAEDTVSKLKSREKGWVNERQYCERLVEVIERDTTSFNPTELMASQNSLRLDYESARRVVRAAVIFAEMQRARAVEKLYRAVQQLDTRGCEFKPGFNPADPARELPMRVAIINCLAADLIIRQCGHRLAKAHHELQDDLTGQHGQNAMCREFAAVEKLVRVAPTA